jgi:hypothetical protein
LVLQDDNAKPHHGPFRENLDVTAFICPEASKMGVFLAPKDPAQPAQSPDLNPLDTFVFRILAMKWRRLRAKDLVRQMAAYHARANLTGGHHSDTSRGAVRTLNFEKTILRVDQEKMLSSCPSGLCPFAASQKESETSAVLAVEV